VQPTSEAGGAEKGGIVWNTVSREAPVQCRDSVKKFLLPVFSKNSKNMLLVTSKARKKSHDMGTFEILEIWF